MLSDEQIAELRRFLASGTEEYVASVRRDMMLSLLSAHDDAVRMRAEVEDIRCLLREAAIGARRILRRRIAAYLYPGHNDSYEISDNGDRRTKIAAPSRRNIERAIMSLPTGRTIDESNAVNEVVDQLTALEEAVTSACVQLCALSAGCDGLEKRLTDAKAENERLEVVLEAIARGAPQEEPECPDTDNTGDYTKYGSDHLHYHLAKMARAALRPAEQGDRGTRLVGHNETQTRNNTAAEPVAGEGE